MITVNWPFFASIIIIAIFLPLQFVGGRYFHGKWSGRPFKAAEDEAAINSEKSDRSRLTQRIKGLFFQSDDLRRPFYVRIPLIILVAGFNFLSISPGSRYIYAEPKTSIIAIVVFAFLAVISDILLMFKANKDFFGRPDNRKRYIKSQSAQLAIMLAVLIPVLSIAYTYISNTDPSWVRDSVEWSIEPEYIARWPQFSEGLAPVEKMGKVGFIDKEGRMVIPARYKYADDFSEGVAAAKYKGKWGYIDKAGNEVLPFIYEEAQSFSNGLAPVKIRDTWSVINREGEVLFETDFEWMDSYSEGVARVRYEDETGKGREKESIIDEEGRRLFSEDYLHLGEFSEGCIPVMDPETHRYYFLDKSGEKVIDRSFVRAESFSGGIAAAVFEDGMGRVYIDRQGRVVSAAEEEYSYFGFHEGLVKFKEGDRYGFKDVYGNILVPSNFLTVTDSSDGMIALSVNGRWGFIENPLPMELQQQGGQFWQARVIEIGNVEGIPVYAEEVEKYADEIIAENPGIGLKEAYPRAFERVKREKAFTKYGEEIKLEEIRYQLANGYYKKVLMGID